MANTYVALSTVTVGAGGAASISFNNIPQTYTDLVVTVSGRSDFANAFNEYGVYLGTDAFPAWGNRFTFLLGNSGSTLSGGFNFTYMRLGDVPGSTATSGVFASNTFVIANYTDQTSWKTLSGLSMSGNGSTTSAVSGNAALRGATGPVTDMVLWNSGNWAQHSAVTLYGVLEGDVSTAPGTPTIGTATAQPEQASITFTATTGIAGSYTVTSTPGSITATGSKSPIIVTGLTAGTSYTFKVKANNPFGSSGESAASNAVTPTVAVNYLVVAGGGGGSTGYSGAYGGGGGGGGVRSSFGTTGGVSAPEAPLTLTTGTNYTVVVGGGGSRPSSGNNQQGTDGGTSQFSTISSTGGGAGAATNDGSTSSLNGRQGGSGGGGCIGATAGSGIAGQGFAGNAYNTGGSSGGGGSSGAFPLGAIDNQSSAGVGNTITGSIVQYAKGGSGTGSTTATGFGNGGNGGRYGFGSSQEPSGGNAGVVILRYPSAYTISLSGLSGSTATVGGFKVTTITSVGSGTVSWT